MNILQQIWTYSTVFSDFLVNLVHAVPLVPIIDHDVVAVGETVQFFTVPSVNGGQIAVAVVVVAHQFLTIEGDGSEAVRRRRERRFSRGRLKNRNLVHTAHTLRFHTGYSLLFFIQKKILTFLISDL